MVAGKIRNYEVSDIYLCGLEYKMQFTEPEKVCSRYFTFKKASPNSQQVFFKFYLNYE